MYVSGSDASLLGPALEATLLKHIFLEVDAVHHSIGVSRRSVLQQRGGIQLIFWRRGADVGISGFWEIQVWGRTSQALR